MSFYGLESIRNLNERIKKNLNISKPVMHDYEFPQQQIPLPGPLGINHLHDITSSVNHIRTSDNSLWDHEWADDYRDIMHRYGPPPKREPIIEHKINEEKELRKKIDQYKDINEGLIRTNNQLQQSINEKTARINQLGKEKVGPFNIVIDTIDTSYVRDEKLTEIENLRNEFALVDRKGVELSKQMTELRRINLKLDLKLKGRNVRFDIKGIFF